MPSYNVTYNLIHWRTAADNLCVSEVQLDTTTSGKLHIAAYNPEEICINNANCRLEWWQFVARGILKS